MKSLLYLFGALAAIQSVAGQTASVPVKAELRLLAFSTEMEPKTMFAQDPGASADAPSVPVTMLTYLNHQFNPITLTSHKVIFTAKADRLSATRPDELLGEVTLPEGGDSSILLFLPGKPGGKAKYQVMPVADSRKAFPAGSFHITNLSALPVRLMLEAKNFDFKPGQTILIQDPPMRANGQSGMRAFAFKDEKWSAVSTGLWPSPGDSRGLMVFYQDPETGNLQLQSFDDIPPRAAKVPDTTVAQ
jgi:hypothetical protein